MAWNDVPDYVRICTQECSKGPVNCSFKEEWAYGKEIYQMDADGNVVATWTSIDNIAKKTGFSKVSLRKAVTTGLRYKGYFWEKELL